MSYVIAWAAVYMTCMGDTLPVCNAIASQSFETEKECRVIVDKQNAYWKLNNVSGKMYCLQSVVRK